MNAAFDSWSAFFAMGGYAFYVWLAVAATLISLLGLVAHTVWQRRQLLAEIGRRQARERRIRHAQQSKQKIRRTAGEIIVNPRRKSRLYLAIVVLIGIALTATLMLYALRSNIDLFYTPGEILQGKGENHEKPEVGQRLRIGGMVMPGSVKRDPNTLQVSFKIYDARGAIGVTYTGILPDLFREGQGRGGAGRAGRGQRGQCARSAGQTRREIHAAGSGRRDEREPQRPGGSV